MCKYNCLILPSHRWFVFTFPHLWFSRLVNIFFLSIPHFRRCGSCGLRPFVCPSLSLFRRYNGIIWYNFALLISWTMIHITFRWNTFICSVVHVISWYLMIFHRWIVGHVSLITTSKSQSPSQSALTLVPNTSKPFEAAHRIHLVLACHLGPLIWAPSLKT